MRAALHVADDDDILGLLAAAGEEVVATGERQWLGSLGITPTFWSRIDDRRRPGDTIALAAPRTGEVRARKARPSPCTRLRRTDDHGPELPVGCRC